MANLVGTLQHAATRCKWAKFLLMSLVHSIFVALKGNVTTLKKQSRTFKGLLNEIERKKISTEDVLKGNFALSKAAKKVWNFSKRYFLLPTMKSAMRLLLFVLENPDRYKWETPITHLVERDPDFITLGDASLDAGGGYSMDLKFWWQIHWPEEIQERTLLKI